MRALYRIRTGVCTKPAYISLDKQFYVCYNKNVETDKTAATHDNLQLIAEVRTLNHQ